MNMPSESKKHTSGERIIDFDIHGLVGIRLIDPLPPDVAAVARQLGPLHSQFSREPDIVIRIVRNLPTPSLNYLGADFSGFTKDAFYILKSRKAKTKVKIPFDKIGGPCELVCQSGFRSVPLLTAIINLTLLKKNYLPLHASAFVYKDTGILTTGWSKGGKTEALLAFANHGAQYVGDEWVILSADGQEMCGLPEPIHMWDWQLKYLSNLKPPVKMEKRIQFKFIRFLDYINNKSVMRRFNGVFPLKYLNEAMAALKRQLHVTIAPQDIFQKEFMKLTARPEKLFFIMSHSYPWIVVEPYDSLKIARHMIHSNQYEQMPFLEYYKAFRFAFPDLKNDFLENLDEFQNSLLCRVLKGKEAYRVLHPYPVSLDLLFGQMEQFCHKTAAQSPVQNGTAKKMKNQTLRERIHD